MMCMMCRMHYMCGVWCVVQCEGEGPAAALLLSSGIRKEEEEKRCNVHSGHPFPPPPFF
jgi:hypothetical protein